MKTVLIRFLRINSTVNLRSLPGTFLACWGVSGSRARCLLRFRGGSCSVESSAWSFPAGAARQPVCSFSFVLPHFFDLILEEASVMDIVQWCPGLESGCTLSSLVYGQWVPSHLCRAPARCPWWQQSQHGLVLPKPFLGC